MSGFFGVTTLGSDRPVYSHLRSSLCACQYTDAEFQEVFNKMPKSKECAESVEGPHIITLLTMTYSTSPLPEELMLFFERLDLDNKTHFKWDCLKQALHTIRKDSQGLAKRATQYSSLQDLKDDKRKHNRVRYGPLELYKLPMTGSQQIGYFDHQKAIREREC